MSNAESQRILLIQLYHLGDVVLTTPAIRAARARFPNARIDFLTGSLGAQALEGNPHLDNILVDPARRELRRTKYDMVADMHSIPRTALYTFATRARVRAGVRGRGPRNLAYSHLRERDLGALYMAEQKLRVLPPLGINGGNLELDVFPTEADRSKARDILAKLHPPVIAISPVSKHNFKQWGAGKWAAVADRLAEAGLSILITSGPGEEDQARAVTERMTHSALWQYGATTIRELCAMYARCCMWLGNDGGPKHVAVAAKIPTITVYRKKLGRVWSDPEDQKQIQINSGAETLEGVAVHDVLREALRLRDSACK